VWRCLAAAGRVAVELQVGAVEEDVGDEDGDYRGLHPCERSGVHLGVGSAYRLGSMLQMETLGGC